MNAAVPPDRLAQAILADSSADTVLPKTGRDRRGPFRPEKLLSARQRGDGDMYVRLFRAVDGAAVLIFTLLCAKTVLPAGLLAAPLGDVLPFATGVAFLAWALPALGLYRFGRSESLVVHLARLTCAFAASLAAAYLTGLLAPHAAVPALIPGWTGLTLAVVAALHIVWWGFIRRWRRLGKLTPSIVIVGATKHAHKLIEAAKAQGDVNVLGIFDDRLARNPDAVAGVPVLGDVQALLGHKITPYVDQIVVALDTTARARVKGIIEKLRALPNEVALFVDVETDKDVKTAWSRVADMPLARVSGVPSDSRKAFVKRVADIVIGAIALVVFSPVMLVVAALIKMDSPGPVFFRQRRHGFNNEAIFVWKFRSMYTHLTDHTAAQQVTKGDPRVTRIGRFIRKTSIDELPQLFNVLIGEMSLVGPRPHAIGMKTGSEESARLVAEYAWRHRMKPGVTGWAAIHGSRGPMDTPEDVKRRIALDVEYIERQSLWLDLRIMAMTIPCLLGDAKTVR
jgi:polysaccharide biosynthesis protein PslA